MRVQLRQINGQWNAGWVLDKHMIRSTYLGDDENGRPRFDNERTEVGEAVFQLKYRSDRSQAAPLAEAVAIHILPLLPAIGLIIPMPASTPRPHQPVNDVATALGRRVNVPVFERLLLKNGPQQALKDLPTREARVAALADQLTVHDEITSEGRWNALLLDDLFDTGTSMEAACRALRGYRKISGLYVAALTWK